MKAITVCQPYAELIAREGPWRGPIVRGFEKIHYPKRVENRTWSTNYRGELGIHAGKSRQYMPDADALMHKYSLVAEELVFGAVIAMVRLVECVPLEELRNRTCRTGRTYRWVIEHEYTEGPICWVLEDVRRIEPIYCNGFQGLWSWNGKAMVAT